MNSKLTAQIAAAYRGCEVAQWIPGTKDGVHGKLVTIEVNGCGVFLDKVTTSYARYEDCQLLLTPLSDITDEHAIEVAKMHGFTDKNSIGTLINVGKDVVTNPARMQTRSTDYLRYKGYDLGYQDIPSLIDAGIAIKNTVKS